MKIAYLVNQYPKTSHAFIRREILALEAAGVAVARYTIRRTREQLADAEDVRELARTQVILSGVWRLLSVALITAAGRPVKFWRGVRGAMGLARRSGRSRWRHLAYLVEACVLRRWLAAEGVEHLHVHFGTNSAAVGMLCRELGGPTYSMTVHGPDEFDAAPMLGLDSKARRAGAVIGVSEYSRSQLARWLDRADHRKLEMVHCGLDEAFLSARPAAMGEARRLVFVGRLTATKGVFVLLEAMRRLRERGEAGELVMLGDGPDRAAIEARVVEHGLRDCVRLLGWAGSEVVRGEIEGSRALVLPSFAEGLPVVLMESLALCRPVITTWVAGIPELVEHGVDGWLVAPGSVEGLARAMGEALSMGVERLEEMGRHGREKVVREHRAKTEAVKLAGIFRRAVEAA